MGLGGYLTWTAAAREIRKRAGSEIKILPVEQHGNFIKIIKSEIFDNSSDFFNHSTDRSDTYLFPVILNNPNANYCKRDTPDKAYHRSDSHIIEQCCEVYGIQDPELKCDIEIDINSQEWVDSLVKKEIGDEPFITIEPISKENYTKNRR